MALVKKSQRLQKRPMEIRMDRAEFSDLIPGVAAIIEKWSDIIYRPHDSKLNNWLVISKEQASRFFPSQHISGDIFVRYDLDTIGNIVYMQSEYFKDNFPIYKNKYCKYMIRKLVKTPEINFESREELAEYLKNLQI